MVAVAYEKWSLTRGSKYSNLTWKFWYFGKLVAEERCSPTRVGPSEDSTVLASGGVVDYILFRVTCVDQSDRLNLFVFQPIRSETNVWFACLFPRLVMVVVLPAGCVIFFS